jgi:YVTN family beta-propeller protein
VVDPSSGTVIKRFYAGIAPLGIAVTPAGDKIFVTNFNNGLIKVVSAKDYQLLDDIKVGGGPSAIITSTKGTLAFALNFGRGKVGRVDFIDTNTHRVVGDLELGIRPMAAVISPIGDILYVVCGGSNEVFAIDVTARRVMQQIPVGITPDGVAISADGNTVVVANSGSNDLSIIDVVDMTEKRRVPVGPSPFSLAMTSAGKLIVAETDNGSDKGSISVYGPDFQKVATTRVGKMPQGICLSQDQREVYVPVEKDNKLVILQVP